MEDEQIVALDLQRRLRRLGYMAFLAQNGEEALEKAEEFPPDLVLMDIRLGGEIDGIETALRLRRERDVPIVYLTAYADEGTVARARPSEPYGYIVKPFDERELHATIDLALRRHASEMAQRARDELSSFLAETSAELAASLDYENVMNRAARLLVPRYADWCLIHLRQSKDAPPSYWLGHPSAAPVVPVGGGRLIEEVLDADTGRTVSAISDPRLLADELGQSCVRVLEGLRLWPKSLLCVPLRFRRPDPRGALLLASARHERFEDKTLVFMGDFADRLAMAVDNGLLYREAQRAVQTRQDILAIVSHDLRNPLGAIILGGEFLMQGGSVRETAAIIVRSARRMNRLIDDLLDTASMDAGRFQIERRPCDITQLARDVVTALRPSADAKKIRVVDDIPVTLGNIACDADRIHQVLTNLLGNAIKFTPPSGTVTVLAEQEGAYVRLAVSDTGAGVPEEQQPHLFERFWRARGGRGGTGLGLSIAKGIVEAHGGALWFEPRAGGGSTFCFRLPISAREAAARVAA